MATRTKRQPVQNLGRYKPSRVVQKVKAQAPGFTMSDFVWFWKHYAVRPGPGAPDPAATDARYCVWDEPHGDYLYTDAWIAKLIAERTPPSQP